MAGRALRRRIASGRRDHFFLAHVLAETRAKFRRRADADSISKKRLPALARLRQSQKKSTVSRFPSSRFLPTSGNRLCRLRDSFFAIKSMIVSIGSLPRIFRNFGQRFSVNGFSFSDLKPPSRMFDRASRPRDKDFPTRRSASSLLRQFFRASPDRAAV